MKQLLQFFSVLLVLVMLGGCQQTTEPKKDSTVRGGTVTGHILDPFEQTGVVDVKVYLLSKDVAIDTVTGNNEHAFIDSAVTDTTGHYTLEDIKPGNYGLFPSSPPKLFKPDSSSDPHEFEIIDGDTFTINFLQELPKIQSGMMVITVDIVGSYSVYAVWPYICRQEWAVFVPYWSSWLIQEKTQWLPVANPTYRRFITCQSYGWTAGLYTVSNKFKIRFLNAEEYPFIISFGLSNAPAESHWEYDSDTHVLTRIE
ncbi:carboxypeptidase regulatory-like domain-containing protein [candidate division KSB1 bacterium]|nr:carboxypeptidase regulatory-like domain-containing protein [candidate division KSB1 bacterium]